MKMNKDNIKDKIKELLNYLTRKDVFYLFLLMFILFFYSSTFIFNYLNISDLSIVGGWDGSHHFAISKFYAQSIFPDVFSWTFNWNAGMVFPLGYPPFSYMFLGFLNWILPFSFQAIFKYFFILTIVSLPIIFYYVGKGLQFTKKESFLSALLLVFFLVSPFYFASGGFSFSASFKSGLYSQLLAGLFFLLWMYYFLQSFGHRKYFILSTFFLFLILLTNIHVGETALVFLFSFFVGDVIIFRKYNRWKPYLLQFVLAFSLLSFWSFPLIMNLDYFPSMTFQPVHINYFMEFPVLIMSIFSLYGIVLAVLKKDRVFISIAVASILFFILTFLPVSLVFKSIPLQPGRIIPALFITLSILSIYALKNFPKNIKFFGSSNYLVLFSILFLPFVLYTFPIDKNFNFPYVLPSTHRSLQALNDLSEGRSTIEILSQNAPVNNYLAAHVPLNSPHQTIWNVFRESTLNSVFTAPLRNFFSERHESYGVVCGLCHYGRSEEIKDQGLTNNIERAKLYGLKYFLLREGSTYEKLLQDPRFELREINYDYLGKWSLFQLKEDIKYAQDLEYEPALVYADLESKHRDFQGLGSYNWLGIAEYWFEAGNFDIVLARDDNSIIEDKDLQNFKNLVLFDYSYKDLNSSFLRLEEYVKRGNTLIVFFDKESPDKLALKLKELDYDNLKIIEKSLDAKEDSLLFMDILEEGKQARNNLVVNKAILSGNSIEVDLKKNDIDDIMGEKNKVYVKSSYFPLWEAKNENTNIYMAAGAMTLVISEDELISLQFNKYPPSFKLGVLISLISLLILIYLYFRINNYNFLDDSQK